ncbi:trypsin-like peptidase domain-containing protein [Neoroseomonas oryzicola]|uniref:Trypsin-like peptidase domain-containing protein n=3 Tax=Neoroseomonas oryzicola TaxID=535904 RepID=A0ABX1EEB3_9PROT|nr:trypsin-like peptidase domain-containing protein [Neoroseomonas oryzicola]NKE15822.1 trypsin-like peptidase domain-containing protein [Neoroseomonas oryzicola]
MASPRFILKTDLQGLEPVAVGGAAVLDADARLRSLLGPDRAALFAEPVVTWGNGRNPGSVSWYAEAAGDPVPLASLPPQRRAMIEARLQQDLAALAPLMGDPLLRGALVLAGPDSILALDDRPVLTGWGLAPPGALRDAAARAAHLRSVYGAALPPALAAEGAPAPEPPRPAAPPPRPAAAPVPPPVAPMAAAAAAPVAARATSSAWNWWLLPIGVLVALIFLGLGFWLGWRLISERIADQRLVAHVADSSRIDEQIIRQRQTNEAIQREIEQARQALQGDVCRPGDFGLSPLTPPQITPMQPSSLPPTPQGQQAFQGTLIELLDQATVLVLGPLANGQGVGTGTGFVVAPGVVVTNAHVVAPLDPARVYVVNRRLGRPVTVQVMAQTPEPAPGKPDFALLRLPAEATALSPLGLTRVASRLDPVIAAGFPQAIMQTDANFQALLDGNIRSVPELAVTDGLVSAVQNLPSGLTVLPHTAAISRGNSGGPLVDRCGRVVGVNTFGFFNAEQGERVSYAQKVDSLMTFLQANNVNVADLTGACQPAPIAAPPAAPAAAGAPAAPAPAPAAPPAAPAAPPSATPPAAPAAPAAPR